MLIGGLLTFGLGVALMIRADLGLDPWSAFHIGLTNVFPISYGVASVGAGIVLLTIGWRLLGQQIDWGTVLNMVLIGFFADFFLLFVPEAAQFGYLFRWLWLLLAIVLIGLAIGLYIGSRWGAGPRDGFVLSLSKRTGRSVRLLRTMLELSVLVVGVLLGATAGWGTIAFALMIGPAMQLSLRVFRVLPTAAPAGTD